MNQTLFDDYKAHIIDCSKIKYAEISSVQVTFKLTLHFYLRAPLIS